MYKPLAKSRTPITRAELLWFGAVFVLSVIAIAGTLLTDKVREDIPRGAILYTHSDRSVIYFANGENYSLCVDCGDAYAALRAKYPDRVDPLPSLTPWQNLRVYFSQAYGVSMITGKPELIFGKHGQITVLTQRGVRTPIRVPTRQLPASLLFWSSTGEPIAALDEAGRETLALGEGRYGRAEAPSTILLTQVPNAEELVKLLYGFAAPSTKVLPLGDGTIAEEILANTDALEITVQDSNLGTFSVISSVDPRVQASPAALYLHNPLSSVLQTLLFSDSAVAQEENAQDSEVTLRGCPVTSVVTYVRSPFYVFGRNERGDAVFCSE